MDSNVSDAFSWMTIKYDQQDYLVFIAFVSSNQDSCSDSSSDFDDNASTIED